MKRVLKKPYIYWTIAIFIVYMLLNILISGFYSTIQLIFIYARTINWYELSISIIFSLIIAGLVAINAIYSYILYKERKKCIEGNTLTGIGTLGGLMAGVCPLCVTGLFPLILSLLGVTFTFASLPLKGIEIQVLVVAILLISFRMLRKNKLR